MSSTPPPAAFDRRDLAALLVLAAASIALRAAWLDWPAFNPDEGIYAGRATYFVGSGTTPFTRAIGVEHIVELYRWMTLAFGPYPMVAIRGLVLTIALAIAVSVYWIVRGVAGYTAALLAGLTFVFYNLYFEGLSANREWFASCGSWLAVCLFLAASERAQRRRWALVAAAGLAAGMGVWFKEQALLLVLPVGALLAYEVLATRRWRAAGIEASAYIAGGAVAALLYLAPFVAAGSLDDHLYFLIEFRSKYVGAYRDMAAPAPEWLVLWHAFYQDLPWRQFPLVAYLTGGAIAVGLVWGLVRRTGGAAVTGAENAPGGATRAARTAPLLLFYLLAALAAVRLGGKFYAHYYLFLMPPVAALVGIGAGMLWQPLRDPATQAKRGLLAAVVVAGLVIDATLIPPPVVFEAVTYEGHLPALADDAPALPAASLGARLAAAGGLILVGVLAFASARRSTRGRAPTLTARLAALALSSAGGLWLMGLVAALAIQTSRHAGAAARVDNEPPVPHLVAYLHEAARPGDRMMVWGFFTELYLYTQLEAASQLVDGVLVLSDVMRAGPAQIDEHFATLLMDDLTQRRPRWIVDAAPQSVNPELYRIENFPALVELLAAEYELAAQLDGCRLWVRRDDPPPPDLIDPPAPTTSRDRPARSDGAARSGRPFSTLQGLATATGCRPIFNALHLVAPSARAGYDSGFARLA